MLKLLKEAAEEGLISSSQMAKGFSHVEESLDEKLRRYKSTSSRMTSLSSHPKS